MLKPKSSDVLLKFNDICPIEKPIFDRYLLLLKKIDAVKTIATIENMVSSLKQNFKDRFKEYIPLYDKENTGEEFHIWIQNKIKNDDIDWLITEDEESEKKPKSVVDAPLDDGMSKKHKRSRKKSKKRSKQNRSKRKSR